MTPTIPSQGFSIVSFGFKMGAQSLSPFLTPRFAWRKVSKQSSGIKI